MTGTAKRRANKPFPLQKKKKSAISSRKENCKNNYNEIMATLSKAPQAFSNIIRNLNIKLKIRSLLYVVRSLENVSQSLLTL